jgi:hypothetical protein
MHHNLAMVPHHRSQHHRQRRITPLPQFLSKGTDTSSSIRCRDFAAALAGTSGITVVVMVAGTEAGVIAS